jgi:hemolysin activation/secretion protein
MLSSAQSVTVRRFEFTGNTKFSAAELAAVVKGYVGRPISPEDLEQARVALTQYYVNKGYINSGAVLPDQPVDAGTGPTVIHIQIVEGRLSEVRVTFLKGTNKTDKHILRDDYLTSRLYYAGRQPLDVLGLKDELELLRQDPNISSINAELRPGVAPGQADLDLSVRENNPFQFGLQFSNRRPPSVGSTALDVLASDKDLTGHGDLLSLRYDAMYGEITDMSFGGDRDFSIDYSIPVTPIDTTLSFDFTRTNALVVETPFEGLNIASKVNSYALTVRQPVWRRPTSEPPAQPGQWAKPAAEFALFLTGTIRDDDTSLLGEPFDFLPGVESGHSRVVALRFGQELTTRTEDDALSLRSTFSFGLPIFNATQNSGPRPFESPNVADSQFVSWLGQAQYVRRLGPVPNWLGGLPGRGRPGSTASPGDVQLVLRVAGQLTNSPLLDVEQFVVGGVETVRGYQENQLVRDEGVVASAELHVPIIPGRGGDPDRLTLVPFFDTGYARDLVGASSTASNQGESLNSVGIGLLYNPERRINLQVYYGYALTHRNTSHQDPQDLGIHFSLTVFAF